MKLPTEVARNQMPITSPAIRAGASLVIALKPTGLRHSSPNVWRRYVIVSHIGLTPAPDAASVAGMTSVMNPAATAISPSANFTGVDGSRRPRRSHSHANTGANAQMKNEFIDWNQLLGYAQPKIDVAVSRSANKFRVDPACSNSDQNTA